jgi:SAM-dependent methyltransferase
MQPSLWNLLRKRWRDTRARKNSAGSIREIAADVWEFVLESTPPRRRARYGDVEYDWDHQGVDTTSATVTTWTRLLAAISGAPYQPTEPTLFAEMLNALDIDFERFTFVDIGSGKGRTLLMAAEFGFRHVIGVELLPELHDIAVRNIGASGKLQVESLCQDAREYRFPSDPLVLYLFNPLPAAAVSQVIETLHASLDRNPREMKIIYHNPLFEDVLANAPFLKKVRATYQYAIYSN